MITGRIIFLLYNHHLTRQLDFPDILLSILHGFRMDASIVGYFLALYGLLLTISVYRNGRWVSVTVTFITICLLIFCALVATVDLELYRHWGFRMNTTPLLYIGSEAMGSISLWVYIKITFLFSAILVHPSAILPNQNIAAVVGIGSAIEAQKGSFDTASCVCSYVHSYPR